MTFFETSKGSRTVHTACIRPDCYESRLFVNNGETATLTAAVHKTEAGARKWAKKVLSR